MMMTIVFLKKLRLCVFIFIFALLAFCCNNKIAHLYVYMYVYVCMCTCMYMYVCIPKATLNLDY
jgi:hypothetical protein